MQRNPEFVALSLMSRAARRIALLGHRPVRRPRYSINIATFAGLQRPHGELNEPITPFRGHWTGGSYILSNVAIA